MSDKRQRILTATEALLAEHGFHGLSMQMVAKKADVAIGTIYRYFSDKDDLIEQLHQHLIAIIATEVQKNVTDDLSLKMQYRTMWLNTWHFTNSNRSPMLTRNQFKNLPCGNKPTRKQTEIQHFDKVRNFYNEGLELGLFKPLPIEILATLSLETSASLARKQVQNIVEVTEPELDLVIESTWQSILK
ncbi:TetR/AcrR family transcriptional regulator [Vibrio sp. SS-MA-C1-2]|uniref:TetR/AcrR family transcriptional regulator n=1 Tax=Vibrio sp. SS-MA-C1-2 TaxID=2908646 RepID=UPI001F415DC6|nr:TetR/AcrR family transcriptional regulator [Vibrio sp. SS-MA-C1-2]UJF19307.1 TetR/AcrR family transcriptional regulator [Vibrio sp. SS-MA-C1-2]